MSDVFYKVTFVRDQSVQSVMVPSGFPMSLDKVVKKARAIFRSQIFPPFCAYIVDEYRFKSIEMV